MQIENWHILENNPKDLPTPGDRVIICVQDIYVGEGYVKQNGEWWRYCDFGPVERFMSGSVTAWTRFPDSPNEMIKKKSQKTAAKSSRKETVAHDGKNEI